MLANRVRIGSRNNEIKYVAAGKNDSNQLVMMASTDGIDWGLAYTMPGSTSYTDIYDIMYANGMFVAVGGDYNATNGYKGIVLTSIDGINWVLRILFDCYPLTAVDYSASSNTFVAVGSSGQAATSVGGETWIKRNTGSTRTLNDIAYSLSKNIFVAVGSVGEILSSVDGITWTQRDPFGPLDDNLRIVIYSSNGRFVATGDRASTTVSTDGINWSDRIHAADGSNYNPGVSEGIAYAGNKYAIARDDGHIAVSSSSTGESWSDNHYLAYIDKTGTYSDILYGFGRFVAIGYINYNNYYATIATSTSGNIGSWSEIHLGTFNPSITDLEGIIRGEDKFIVIGWGSADSFKRRAITSSDGLNWTVHNKLLPCKYVIKVYAKPWW